MGALEAIVAVLVAVLAVPLIVHKFSDSTSQKVWRRIEVVSSFSALGLFLGGWLLWWHFNATRPIAPNSLDGRVYPLDPHGWRVYLTSMEQLTLNLLFNASLALFVIAAIIDRIKKPFDNER
jgi:hypothetical protein